MKRFVRILTMALIFSVGSTTVIAAKSQQRRNYVDEDGDGVCDNYGSNQNGCGNRSGRGNRSGCGKGYVDEDGDGVCDNYSSDQNGCANRYGQGNHSGCGKEYVDEDGDGVCDNIKYSIKYNLNGGKNNKKNPSCYYNTTKTIKLKKPTKKGYVFKGWYADKQCRKKVTAIKKGSSGKKTLYAKWKKKHHE